MDGINPFDYSEQASENEEEMNQNINSNVSQNMTMDASYGLGYRSPCMAIYSPGQGRSVREYEEQMAAFRKENFNLKLKIYVLEEKLPGLSQVNTPDGKESLMKQYLEVKVETEILKNDLEEKRLLLREAAEAINHLENIQKESDKRNAQMVDELKHKIQFLENENKILEKSSKSSFMSGDESKISESALRVQELEISVKNSEVNTKKLTNHIKKMEEAILKKNKTVEELETSIQKLQSEYSELKDVMDMNEKTLNTTDVTKMQTDLIECRSELANKMCELDDIQEKFAKQNEDNGKALKCIEKLVKVSNALKLEVEELKRGSNKENGNNIPNELPDKSSSGSSNKKLQNKIDLLSNQVANLAVEAENKNSLLAKLKAEAEQARNDSEKAHKWSRECSNICNTLTIRLEELASFLDSLLKHKNVLSAIDPEKKREIQNAISKSLDLSRSLTAESLSITSLSFDESNLAQLSNITGILENSHVTNKSDDSKDKLISNLKYKLEPFREKRMAASFTKTEINKVKKKNNITLPLAHYEHSDFEVWSEPDRSVSLARIGLNHPIKLPKNLEEKNQCESEKTILNSASNSSSQGTDEKNKSTTKLHEKITQYEQIIAEKENKILDIQCQLVESDNRLKKQSVLLTRTINELEENADKIKCLEFQLETFKSQFENINMLKVNEEKLKQELLAQNDEIHKMKEERNKLHINIEESETMIKNLLTEAEELKQKYEENLTNIKENEFIQFEKLKEEYQTKLIENIKEIELNHQEELNKDWVTKVEYTHVLNHAKILESELKKSEVIIKNLKESELEFKEQLNKNEKIIQTLQQNVDEHVLSLSKASFERSKISNEKLDLQKYVQELLENCQSLRNENNLLIDQTNTFLNKQIDCHKCEENLAQSSEENHRQDITSPDLGIESDTGRTTNDDIKVEDNRRQKQKNKENVIDSQLPSDHKCEEIQTENLKLREKYKRLARVTKEIMKVMKKKNDNMEQFEHNIMIQIQKTNVVLEYARNNFSNDIKQNNSEN